MKFNKKALKSNLVMISQPKKKRSLTYLILICQRLRHQQVNMWRYRRLMIKFGYFGVSFLRWTKKKDLHCRWPFVIISRLFMFCVYLAKNLVPLMLDWLLCSKNKRFNKLQTLFFLGLTESLIFYHPRHFD